MTRKNIALISDWTLADNGDGMSGYTNIILDIGIRLSHNHNIIAFGPAYRRTPHKLPFSLTMVPFQRIPSALASIDAYRKLDMMIVALDIPMQVQLLKLNRNTIKYTGIFAVEADPLYSPWAMALTNMDYAYTISDFGMKECQKVGVDAKHYVVPTNRTIWYPAEEDEKSGVREILGITGKYVLFINADGNERKNLSASIQAIDILVNKRGIKDIQLYILTRVGSPVSWDLSELITRYNLHKYITVLDRGLSYEEIRRLYVASDLFMNVTKAEGMSFPILEAMSVGTPVLCTNASSMKDHIGENNAFGIDADYIHIDVFGNTNRYYVFPETIANEIERIRKLSADEINEVIKNASNYIDYRNSQNALDELESIVKNG